MSFDDYIRAMPKVELHVHLEGAIQPATLLQLAKKHQVTLPADTVEGLRQWYQFTDFNHFIEIYLAISGCIRTVEDVELIAREFLTGQAAQNIRYSEVTYTIFTHYHTKGLAAADQLAALNRAREWAKQTYGVDAGWVLDISREVPPEHGLFTAQWAVQGMHDHVVALGLGGPEVGNPPEKFSEAFQLAQAAGLPCVPHAGETQGADSMWSALKVAHGVRLGHGVRCLEDPQLVEELRARQVPLEVCPTSNVCLHVAPSIEQHPLPRLLEAGLYVTLNSDDPALFNTTLTDEYLKTTKAFDWNVGQVEAFSLRALRASLLPDEQKAKLQAEFKEEFSNLRKEHSF